MGKKFIQQKSEAVNKYRMSLQAGDVDPELIPLLDFINSSKEYYTTSSCAGRISLLQELGGKGKDRSLGKWHRKVDFEEVLTALKTSKGTVWFMYEPTILHVVARTLEGANKLLEISRESGFKRTGIQGINEERFMVEVCSTERIDVPIVNNGRVMVSEKYIKNLIDTANSKFEQGEKKLKRLEIKVRNAIT